jgi:hypothetical protein
VKDHFQHSPLPHEEHLSIVIRPFISSNVHFDTIFVTGATARNFRKAKESDIEDAIAEVLRNAPHRPGGSKYMVKYTFFGNNFKLCASRICDSNFFIDLINGVVV